MNFTKRMTTALAAGLAAALLLAGCAPAEPRAESSPPPDAPASDVYVEEFEPAVARTATGDEWQLLMQSESYRTTAAILSEDGATFRVLRDDNGEDTCSQAPVRLMVLDADTILITYDYVGDPGQICTLTATTRVDEFQVPPGVAPEGMEVRFATGNSFEQPLTFDAPSASTPVPLPSVTPFDGVVAPVASAAQSALMPGTDPTQRPPVLVADDDTFTIIRQDRAEPCTFVPSELIVLSPSEISIHYRSLESDGDGASCSIDPVDRADVFDIPAGVSGPVSVTITREHWIFGAAIIEPATT